MRDRARRGTSRHPLSHPASTRARRVIGGDGDRVNSGFGEVVDAGIPTAVAVIALLDKHLALSLVVRHGMETAALLPKTILDAGAAVDEAEQWP